MGHKKKTMTGMRVRLTVHELVGMELSSDLETNHSVSIISVKVSGLLMCHVDQIKTI